MDGDSPDHFRRREIALPGRGDGAMAVLAGIGLMAAATLRRLAILHPQRAGEGGLTVEPS